MSDPVLLERDGPVATLVLNRPEVLNALDLPMARRLAELVSELEADREVRAVVIRGAGRGFMAGGDVAGFHAAGEAVPHAAGALIDTYHAAVRALVRMPRPVIAALHGPVAGAGMSLALGTDLAVAAEDAVFTLAYVHIGTSPDGGSTHFLPRLVGRRKAMELALLSDRIDARTALDLGLVNRVVASDALAAEASALAQRLAAGPTLAHAATKRLIAGSFDTDLDSQLEAERAGFVACAATRDFREGVAAFVEKRRPGFEGR